MMFAVKRFENFLFDDKMLSRYLITTFKDSFMSTTYRIIIYTYKSCVRLKTYRKHRFLHTQMKSQYYLFTCGILTKNDLLYNIMHNSLLNFEHRIVFEFLYFIIIVY